MLINVGERIAERSTGRLSAKQLMPVREALETSKTLYNFDNERRKNKGSLKFTTPQMLIFLMYIEIKKFSLPAMHHALDGRGGQMILRNLGMPLIDGRYVYPSDGWISDFRNKEYPMFRDDLEKEMQAMIMSMNKGLEIRYTVDSTPVEASRYSSWADFNPHYRIRMGKMHIVMRNGIPFVHKFTNGNSNDCPVFIDLLENFDGVKVPDSRMLADGGYDSFETYEKVFMRTGCIMHGNPGNNGVYHEEAEWKDILRRYNRMHNLDGFITQKNTTPNHILRFMVKNGEEELVGKFLRNLDIRRGNRIHEEAALDRHICETVHHAMKRWVNFDVRGIMYRFVERRLSLKIMFCTFLALLFEPYVN